MISKWLEVFEVRQSYKNYLHVLTSRSVQSITLKGAKYFTGNDYENVCKKKTVLVMVHTIDMKLILRYFGVFKYMFTPTIM